MTAQEAARIVARHIELPEIDRLVGDLLRFPSPQTALLEADPQIKKFIAELVAPRLKELTGDTGAIDAMGNIVWRVGNPSAHGLMFVGYAMTFPAASMADPFSGRHIDGQSFGIQGPCISGRGACEQKGALAAMLYAAAIVTRAGVELKAPLLVAVCVAGETGRHDAAEFIMRNDGISVRTAIIGLGTNNQIGLGNKGRLDIELTVRGKAAHSSMPWLGVNAVDGFRLAMDRLDRLPLGAKHPALGDASLTVTQVKTSPDISHTIPDYCHAMLDRRLLPGDGPDEAFGQIRAALKDIERYSIEIKRGPFMYPAEVARGASLVRELETAFHGITADNANCYYSPAALDAGYLIRQNVETVMFGPGDLRFAHTDQELVSLAQVRTAAQVYAATALQMLG